MATNQNQRNYSLFSRANADGSGPAQLLTNAYGIKWGLRLGKPGFIDITLPARGCQVNPAAVSAYDLTDFDQNDWIDLYRNQLLTDNASINANGGDPVNFRQRVGPAPFLVTNVEVSQREDGLKTINLHAETPLGVLARRVNAYDSAHANSDLAAMTADDFMKFVMTNNYAAGASSHRNAPGYGPDPLRDASALLSIQADATAAAAGYQPDIENGSILRLLQAAADYSWDNNIALFFDIFATGGAIPFEFRTTVGAYGVDRTAAAPGQIVLQNDLDLTSYDIGFNWDGSANNIYAGGRGATGAARIYEESPAFSAAPGSDYQQLLATVTADPFALREKFIASNAKDTPGIQSDADTARTANNTVFRASGRLNENGRYRYGVDFGFGDLICIVADGIRSNAYIVSEVGSVTDNGSEKLEIGFNTEPLPRAAARGVAGVLSDLSRVTSDLEKLSRLEF